VKPRLLVLGCHGRLGQHLLRVLLPSARVLGLDVQPASFVEHADFHYEPLAGVGRRELRPHFADFRPDGVFNAAAWTDVDGAETRREACWRLNVDLPRALAELCRPRGIWLGQVSSDYVFDGLSGPYEIDAPTAPRGVYARSKLAAENLLRGADSPVLIARTMVLFGKGHGLKPDFLEWVLGELQAGRRPRVVDDQRGNACWALELARTLQRAFLDRRRGLVHVASRGDVSRLELARLAAQLCGLPEGGLEATSTARLCQPAPRPLRSGLRLERSEALLGLRFSSIVESLAAWRDDRPELWSIN
jgi:dTDP-4-dehydrorhamnose reductase